MLFAMGMGFSHMYFLSENLTTLDDLSSSFNGNAGTVRSKYNFGILYNLKHAGLATNLFWWFPFAQRDKYEGYIWNKIGESREHFPINEDSKIHCIKDGRPHNLETMDEVVIAASMAYQNHNLKYLNEEGYVPYFDVSKHYPDLKQG